MKPEHKRQVIQHLAFGPTIEILNYECDYVGIKTAKANGFYYIGDDLHITYEGGGIGKKIGSDCMIYLRSLDDITNMIKVDGEDINPIARLHYKSYGMIGSKARAEPKVDYCKSLNLLSTKRDYSHNYGVDIHFSNMSRNKYWINRNLMSWHFDIFGLTEENSAIKIDRHFVTN